jgi:hypothetical protein
LYQFPECRPHQFEPLANHPSNPAGCFRVPDAKYILLVQRFLPCFPIRTMEQKSRNDSAFGYLEGPRRHVGSITHRYDSYIVPWPGDFQDEKVLKTMGM